MKKKNVIISIIFLVILISIIIVILISNTNTKKIIGTSLDKEMEVAPNIFYKDNTVLIEDYNQYYYLDVKNGKLIYDKLINKENESKYLVKQEEEYFYIENQSTKEKSIKFIAYTEIVIDNVIEYYVIKAENEYLILNTKTDKYIHLDKEIYDFYNIYDAYNNLVSDKYLVVFDSKGRYGVIDYNGKFIIDFEYDSIKINKEQFIVRKNNKVGVINSLEKKLIDFQYDMLFEFEDKYLAILNNKYGVIDSNGNVILKLDYDNAIRRNGHIALSKNDKIGIYTNKYFFEPSIDLSDATKLTSYKFGDNIHILTNDKTYVINNGKLINTIDAKLYAILIDGEEEVYSNKYVYARENNDLTSKYDIYDSNYNKHYSFDISENKIDGDYRLSSNISTSSDKNYSVNISLISDDEQINKVYQYDFDNKKELSTDDLEKNEFDNGITYILDKNNNLIVYNKDKIIGEYKDILYFINDYYFIDINGNVYKLNFIYK